MIIRPNRCENCKFFQTTTNPTQGECHHRSPKSTAFLMQNPRNPQGEPMTIVNAAFPPVQINQWCGDYLPTLTATQ